MLAGIFKILETYWCFTGWYLHDIGVVLVCYWPELILQLAVSKTRYLKVLVFDRTARVLEYYCMGAFTFKQSDPVLT